MPTLHSPIAHPTSPCSRGGSVKGEGDSELGADFTSLLTPRTPYLGYDPFNGDKRSVLPFEA